jgi:hypothetical protein
MRLISSHSLVMSLILNAMLFALGSAADMQQSGKIFRVGYLAARGESHSTNFFID